MRNTPPLGLLLDIDGPISNPSAKKIIEPTIIPAILTFLDAGCLVGFNTGRSSEFVVQNVFEVLLATGRHFDHTLVHAMCEKGVVTSSINEDGNFQDAIDPHISVPAELPDAIRELIKSGFDHAMFFDETKKAMISVERNHDTSHDEYTAIQPAFIDATSKLMTELHLDHVVVGRDNKTQQKPALQIDPTIIAVDVESTKVGKDLGAERIVTAYKATKTPIPQRWITMGDSHSDIAMAQWLHRNGYDVTHVDVAHNTFEETEVEVVQPEHTYDKAGAAYLQRFAYQL